MDAELIGRAAVALGAGRDRAEAGVDPAAGIDILAPVGAAVAAGQPVCRLMGADAARLDAARALVSEAVTIGDTAPAAEALVLERIANRSIDQ